MNLWGRICLGLALTSMIASAIAAKVLGNYDESFWAPTELGYTVVPLVFGALSLIGLKKGR